MTELIVNIVNRADLEDNEKAYYIGRPSILGNPFSFKEHGREPSVDLYKNWLNIQYQTNNKRVIDELQLLADILRTDGEITISNWEYPEPSNADVVKKAILNLINRKIV